MTPETKTKFLQFFADLPKADQVDVYFALEESIDCSPVCATLCAIIDEYRLKEGLAVRTQQLLCDVFKAGKPDPKSTDL